MPRPATKVVMVTGAVPGVGKTTLSRAVTAALADSRRNVMLFHEADILERKEFGEVVASFRTTGSASMHQLLDASRRLVQSAVASDVEVLVQDMLFPFLPSLLAWGHSDEEIVQFLAALGGCCGAVEFVQVHVTTGDAAESLTRAADREGDGWLEWFIAKVATYADSAGDVHDFDSVVRYLVRAQRRTERLLASAPWPVVTIASAEEVDASVMQIMALLGLTDTVS